MCARGTTHIPGDCPPVKRVDREGELLVLDVDAPTECPWCGDTMREGECARLCPASRRAKREEREG